MTRVKICGITNLQDAKTALLLGADAIGFVFAKSPRRVKPKDVKQIIKELGPWAVTVGVFVNEKPSQIRKIAQECALSAVQLHGDEKPKDLGSLKGLKIIKAFRVGADFKQETITAFDTDAYLFDTKSDTGFGGTGKGFDWRILDSRMIKKPFIISGGIKISNVEWAVKFFSPYGVDVSSGVEKSPGVKDPELIKKFITNAKS